MPSKPSKPYLTPREVADLLMVSPITVRQWAQKGRLRAETTPGGHRRFPRRYVEAFARERGLALQWPDDGRLRILVADAEPEPITEMLAGMGVLVRSARTAFDAGTSVQSFAPHVLVLDVAMPGLDPVSVCEQVKREPGTRRVDVVAVGRRFPPEAIERMRQAGAKTCLSKPVDGALLRQALGLSSSPRPAHPSP